MSYFRPTVYIILLLLCPSLSWTDTVIPIKCRVNNTPPGWCTWACIETLCKTRRIQSGYNLVENRGKDPDWEYCCEESGRRFITIVPKNYGCDGVVRWKLTTLGIPFRLNPTGKTHELGMEIIRQAVKEERGVVVNISQKHLSSNVCHAIIIIGWNEQKKTCRFVDTNDTSVNYERSFAWFKEVWTGFVLDIAPPH